MRCSGSERWILSFRKIFSLLSLEDVYNVRDGIHRLLRVYPGFAASLVISLENSTISLLDSETAIKNVSTRPYCADVRILLLLYRFELNRKTLEGEQVRSGRPSSVFMDIFGQETNNDVSTVSVERIVEVFYRMWECLTNLTPSENATSQTTSETDFFRRLQAMMAALLTSTNVDSPCR